MKLELGARNCAGDLTPTDLTPTEPKRPSDPPTLGRAAEAGLRTLLAKERIPPPPPTEADPDARNPPPPPPRPTEPPSPLPSPISQLLQCRFLTNSGLCTPTALPHASSLRDKDSRRSPDSRGVVPGRKRRCCIATCIASRTRARAWSPTPLPN